MSGFSGAPAARVAQAFELADDLLSLVLRRAEDRPKIREPKSMSEILAPPGCRSPVSIQERLDGMRGFEQFCSAIFGTQTD